MTSDVSKEFIEKIRDEYFSEVIETNENRNGPLPASLEALKDHNRPQRVLNLCSKIAHLVQEGEIRHRQRRNRLKQQNQTVEKAAKRKESVIEQQEDMENDGLTDQSGEDINDFNSPEMETLGSNLNFDFDYAQHLLRMLEISYSSLEDITLENAKTSQKLPNRTTK
eukprot:Nk52_evm3s116 gene=Nk52_evmTU3s116